MKGRQAKTTQKEIHKQNRETQRMCYCKPFAGTAHLLYQTDRQKGVLFTMCVCVTNNHFTVSAPQRPTSNWDELSSEVRCAVVCQCCHLVTMLNIYLQRVSANAYSDGGLRVEGHLHIRLPLFRHATARKSISYSKYITRVAI